MKAKRALYTLLSFLLLFSLFLTACGTSVNPPEKTDPDKPDPEKPGSDSTPPESAEPPVSTPEATEPPMTEPPVTPTNPPLTSQPPKSLKILAIGNSFSSDCMQYLYNIAKDGGVETIILGNLYYGGCSLSQHVSYAKLDSAVYTYYKNTTGTWGSTASYKMSDALADEDWDYISLQQTSRTCGISSSYDSVLSALIGHVKSQCPNAKLIWNMTWAYQQDSTHSSFPSYDRSQIKMYEMIIDVMNTRILPEERFDVIIPCMTSIQNARTSYLGDTLTRDGHHLDYYIGRYIAGLTWYAAITNAPIENLSYNPSTAKINEEMLQIAKEAVTNAINAPLTITESKIKTGTRPDGQSVFDPTITLSPEDFIEADTATAAAQGVDLSKYTLLKWDYQENSYWYCTRHANIITPDASNSTYRQNICTKNKFSITELPAGSIFILDSGWQYRFELFPELNSKYTGKRPGMSTNAYFILTEEFLNGCTYLAWNISSSPKTDISSIYAQAACHLRVYVPNAEIGTN